jgi:choline dehydrogenase
VLAERGFCVAIVEAGPDVAVNRTPALYPHSFGSGDDWGFETVPQANLANRRIRWPRGRGPGGSTRINAMIWYPPTDADLAQLSVAGGPEWTVSALANSLVEVTRWVDPEQPRWTSGATRRFLDGTKSLGLVANVFSRMTHDGQRRTAADVLHESTAVTAITRVPGDVKKVCIENGRAIGVELSSIGNTEPELIWAHRSVIVCAGAVASPSLLIQSGIGPQDMLDANAITTVVVADEMGRNLCDHLIMPVTFATQSCDRFPSSPSCGDISRFRIAHTGPLASNLAECGGVFSLRQDDEDFLAQVHVTPTHYLLHPDDRAPAAMTIGVNLCNPRSRGCIRFKRDVNPAMQGLEIDPAYLNESRDLNQLLAAVEFARSLARQPPLASFVGGELVPSAKRSNRESIVRAVARYAQTLYHPTGTCRMGRDMGAVVDERLAVRGVSGLHVVDASVLPAIPSVNPNAIVMMLAMHAAKLIAKLSL